MVPFDDKSPFVTSGIRVGTPAITTRGLVEEDMDAIVDLIDRVIMDHTNEEVIEQVAIEVNEMMSERAILFSKIKLVIPFLKVKSMLTFDFSIFNFSIF
jgi:glycine/serine hydroxymethyltransferase